MERGERLPSDDILCGIAERLQVDIGELALATYCDRSPLLAAYLQRNSLAEVQPFAPLPINRLRATRDALENLPEPRAV